MMKTIELKKRTPEEQIKFWQQQYIELMCSTRKVSEILDVWMTVSQKYQVKGKSANALVCNVLMDIYDGLRLDGTMTESQSVSVSEVDDDKEN